jgi:hypothetical protein
MLGSAKLFEDGAALYTRSFGTPVAYDELGSIGSNSKGSRRLHDTGRMREFLG